MLGTLIIIGTAILVYIAIAIIINYFEK